MHPARESPPRPVAPPHGLPERFGYADLTPEAVAGLVARAYRALPDDGLLTAIHDRLLDITVRYAAGNSPHYRRVLAPTGLVGRPGRIPAACLTDLPILRRGDLGADGLTCDVGDYATSVYTTGTTSHQPVITDRSAQELAWLTRFFRASASAGTSTGPAVTLLLANLAHGGPHRLPTGGVQISVSLTDERGLNTALALLRRSYRIGGVECRIEAIGGHKMDLLSLTAYADSVGPDVARHVTYLQSTGTMLLDRERRALADFWSADVADRFGTSEVLVGAWSCPVCAAYHFEPYGRAEVVALDRDEPVRDGYGRLLLTGYLPFTQLTPILRYETGDLARLGVACPTGLPAVELVGRCGASLIGSRRGDGDVPVVSERDIRSVLIETAGVGRRLSGQRVPMVARDVGSLLDFEIPPQRAGRRRLVVPVVFDPAVDGARARSVAESIRDGLVRRTGAPLRDWLDVELSHDPRSVRDGDLVPTC